MSKRLVCGVGINDADYTVKTSKTIGYTPEGKRIQKQEWVCPFYQTWKNMLTRCYSPSYNCKEAYKDCYVCKEWLRFSNFKAWMEQQNWEGMALDKDLLHLNNKCYSPKYCTFIPSQLNSILVNNSGLYCGTCWHKFRGKWRAAIGGGYCSNETKELGAFISREEAAICYINEKLKYLENIISNYPNDVRIKSIGDNIFKFFNDKLVILHNIIDTKG